MRWPYRFALRDRDRRLAFNLYLTLTSALIAAAVAAVELLGCLQTELGLTGGFWSAVASLNSHFEYLGYGVIGLFVVSLGGAAAILKWPRGGAEEELARSLLPEEAEVLAEPKLAAARAYPIYERSGVDA
mmetsp:Transcript_3823/g.8159  ORF Transcript_3823/g.8159 Transcript_3823/m.8159 type:complete len:130 (+) Transcript_3823:1-390(+)